MENLTEAEILELHDSVSKLFNISQVTKDPGLIKSIVERPDTIFSNYSPYSEIFSKAASIMEAIIRWHPFVDGNKRTALLATAYYLHKNNYSLIIPLSMVRFTVLIAKNENNDQESTMKLIEKISQYLQKLSVKKGKSVIPKVWRYFLFPLIGLVLSSVFDIGRYSKRKIAQWMAFDIYPEYEKEYTNILKFLVNVMTGSMLWK